MEGEYSGTWLEGVRGLMEGTALEGVRGVLRGGTAVPG